MGCGGWILWDDVDAPTRQMLTNVVVHEADRLRKYQVPYWHDSRGERFPGDTKAEENAWNSMILNVAVATHRHGKIGCSGLSDLPALAKNC